MEYTSAVAKLQFRYPDISRKKKTILFLIFSFINISLRLHFLADLDVSQLSVEAFRSTQKSLEAGACQSQTSCSQVDILMKRFDLNEVPILVFLRRGLTLTGSSFKAFES